MQQTQTNQTLPAMLDDLVQYWLTSDGKDHPEMLAEAFAGLNARQLAREVITDGMLDWASAGEDLTAEKTHMEYYGYDLNDLTAAVQRFMAKRPDIFNAASASTTQQNGVA